MRERNGFIMVEWLWMSLIYHHRMSSQIFNDYFFSSLFYIYVNAAYNDDLVSFGLNRFKSVTNIMGKI